MDKFCKYLSKLLRNHCMTIYRDTGVFCLSITGTENFQYRPLLAIGEISSEFAVTMLTNYMQN